MEIFMRDISYKCTHHELTRTVAAILHCYPYDQLSSIPVRPTNFHIRLFKDRYPSDREHNGKGILTLPSRELGERFLEEFGDDGASVYQARVCKIRNRTVKFEASHGELKREVVEHISRLPYKDPADLEDLEWRKQELDSTLVQVEKIQFGWECRDRVLSVEWEHNIIGAAWLSFIEETREFCVTLMHGADTLYIIIRYSFIASLSSCYVSGEGNVVCMLLNTALTYEQDGPNPQWPSYESTPLRLRLSCLPMNDHHIVAPYTSLALRLILPTASDLSNFRYLCEVAKLRTSALPVRVDYNRHLFSREKIAQLEGELTKIEWCVAFQVEGIVRKLLVDVSEMLKLIPSIHRMVSARGAKYTSDFLRYFRDRVGSLWFGARDEYSRFPPTPVDLYFLQCQIDYTNQTKRLSLGSDTDVNLFQCLHVTITPTSMALDGPFPEQSNRVIRSYPSDYHSCFLRVTFLDEGQVQYRHDREIDGRRFIEDRVGTLLHDGLTILGRKFKFLVCFEGSHSLPFNYVDTKVGKIIQVTAPSIIESLGKFDEETRVCPARYAARVSQAFTATDSTQVEVEEIFPGQDINVACDGRVYCFTDGVGTLSDELANSIWRDLRGTSKRAWKSRGRPRAFQVRFQGSKGMLSVDHKLEGNMIVTRPSMVKFDALSHNVVEIARAFDSPTGYFLNRPLIMLLEGLGVPYEVFKRYQDKAVDEVKDSTSKLTTAAHMLDKYGLGASYRMSSTMLNIAKLLPGEKLSGDTFYKKLLEFSVHHILRDLKNHARIPVEGGFTLVGICDIHKQLEEMQIYACVQPKDSNTMTFLEGPVLISRSPTIHPGDVQIAYAIGEPPPGSSFDIEKLQNTVVFSVKGKRPLPSMLGGGDLDGDIYNLIPLETCPEFKPKVTYKAASYDPAPRKILDRPSTMDDVAEFIVDFINSDVLGIIANSWLVMADQSRYSIFDPNCLKLSELHSDAVDYPKSGQPVPIQSIPKCRSTFKPDWNAPETINPQNSRDFYESRRAIGRLFRRINLPVVDPAHEYERQRRSLKAQQWKGDNHLAGTLSEVSLSEFSQTNTDGDDDDGHPPRALLSAVERRVHPFIDVHREAPLPVRARVARLYRRYAEELQAVCQTHVVSPRRTTMLSEEEAVVGTVVEKTSRRAKRRQVTAKLREQTERLVRDVREEIVAASDDDDFSGEEEGEGELEKALRRAWVAWQLSLKQGSAFGAKSFGWVALGSIFDVVKEIEDAIKEESRSRGY